MRDTLRKDIFPPLVKPIIRVLDNEATRRDELENGGFDYKEDVKELVETVISDSWSFPDLRP